MKIFALFLIKCYKTISQTFPPRCRFQPNCSSYAYQAIQIYGLTKGLYLSIKRILKCHPFASGGFDPVPLCKNKN
jgi:putative membrane protein insertion efficiency factor